MKHTNGQFFLGFIVGVLVTFGTLLVTDTANARTIQYPDAQGCTTLTFDNGKGYALCGSATCATVNNYTNSAAWIDSRARTHRATYTDRDTVTFNRPVPRSVRLALAKLTSTPPGRKIARACA